MISDFGVSFHFALWCAPDKGLLFSLAIFITTLIRSSKRVSMIVQVNHPRHFCHSSFIKADLILIKKFKIKTLIETDTCNFVTDNLKITAWLRQDFDLQLGLFRNSTLTLIRGERCYRFSKSGSVSATWGENTITGQLQNDWREAHWEWPEVRLTAAPLRYPKYDILMMGWKLGHVLDMHPAHHSHHDLFWSSWMW